MTNNDAIPCVFLYVPVCINVNGSAHHNNFFFIVIIIVDSSSDIGRHDYKWNTNHYWLRKLVRENRYYLGKENVENIFFFFFRSIQ